MWDTRAEGQGKWERGPGGEKPGLASMYQYVDLEA